MKGQRAVNRGTKLGTLARRGDKSRGSSFYKKERRGKKLPRKKRNQGGSVVGIRNSERGNSKTHNEICKGVKLRRSVDPQNAVKRAKNVK